MELWKGGPEKNHANFTPENLVYMIFCGVDTYFPWWKRRGCWKFLRSIRGLKIFRAEIFLASGLPTKCFCEWSLKVYFSIKLQDIFVKILIIWNKKIHFLQQICLYCCIWTSVKISTTMNLFKSNFPIKSKVLQNWIS